MRWWTVERSRDRAGRCIHFIAALGYTRGMEIVAALFADDLDVRQVEGPSTRLDLSGIKFSQAVESFPATIEPHLFVIVRCSADERGEGVLEVRFLRDGEQVARNAQMLQIEPSKFAYRLVRAELEYAGPGTVEAHCRIGDGAVVVVPFTLLAPG
jgi:hypothetical protein